jgi:hypothetical protein
MNKQAILITTTNHQKSEQRNNNTTRDSYITIAAKTNKAKETTN